MQTDQQKTWRTFLVDEKLEDDWLERLNALKHFDLISICQGHADAPDDQPRRRPHFNLRVKDECANALANAWPVHKDNIADAFASAFETAHTTAHLELRNGIIKDKNGVAPQNITLLKVARHTDLLKAQPAAPLHAWFDENVAAAESFDAYLTPLLFG